MHTPISQWQLVAALALCAPALASAEDVVFDAGAMKFRAKGPIEAIVGDTVRVTVVDDDPRRRWDLALDYAEPVADRTKLDLAFVKTLLGGGASRAGGGVDRAPPTGEDKPPLERAKALKQNAAALAADTRRFLEVASATLEGAKALRTEAQTMDEQRADVARRRPANESQAKEFDEALDFAAQMAAVARAVADWCGRAAGEHDLPFTVHDGYRRVAIRACYQQLELHGATVAPRDPICSRSVYDLPVRERPTGPRLTVGVLVPAYFDKPRHFYLEGDTLEFSRTSATTGDPEPALFIGARRPFGRSRAGWGPELGFAVGSRIGEVFTAGIAFDYWGASLGVGLGLDTRGDREAIPERTTGTADERTRTISLVTWYVRLGLSSELWESFTRATDTGGPVNAEQQPPRPTNVAEAATPPAAAPGGAAAPAPEPRLGATPPTLGTGRTSDWDPGNDEQNEKPPVGGAQPAPKKLK